MLLDTIGCSSLKNILAGKRVNGYAFNRGGGEIIRVIYGSKGYSKTKVFNASIDLKFINRCGITANIFRIQSYDSLICRYFYITFINFMVKGKSLTDFTNLPSPNNFKDNDKIILKYIKNK